MRPDSLPPILHSLWRSFRVALGLLTLLPAGDLSGATPAERRQSLYLLPLIGLVIGILRWFAWFMLPRSPWLAAMVVLVIWVVLTGALHLDGLADSMDAWMGGHRDPNRTLYILRDPTCGPMAIVALILALGLKLVSLGTLFQADAAIFLPAVPVIGRVGIIILYGTTPYVRPGGLGEALRPEAQDRYWLFSSLAGSLVVTVLFLGFVLVAALVAAAVAFVLVRWAAMVRLRGFTGDVAGAMIELVETAALLVIALVVAM